MSMPSGSEGLPPVNISPPFSAAMHTTVFIRHFSTRFASDSMILRQSQRFRAYRFPAHAKFRLAKMLLTATDAVGFRRHYGRFAVS